MKQNPTNKQQDNTQIELSPHFPYSIQLDNMLLTAKSQTHSFKKNICNHISQLYS